MSLLFKVSFGCKFSLTPVGSEFEGFSRLHAWKNQEEVVFWGEMALATWAAMLYSREERIFASVKTPTFLALGFP